MKNKINVRTISFVAILGALSWVLMLLRFPLPFAPSFLDFDIAEIPALFTGFFMGPIAGCLVVLIKILLKLAVEGTSTVFVGELSNLILNCCFVLVSSLIYKYKKTQLGAVISLIVATLAVSLLAVATNTLFIFPMYSKLYGMPMDAIVGMAQAVNKFVHDVPTMMWFSVFPFNIVKYVITSVITFVVYKKCANGLRKIIG